MKASPLRITPTQGGVILERTMQTRRSSLQQIDRPNSTFIGLTQAIRISTTNLCLVINESITFALLLRPDGGIGRHAGLKIL